MSHFYERKTDRASVPLLNLDKAVGAVQRGKSIHLNEDRKDRFRVIHRFETARRSLGKRVQENSINC